MQSSWPFLQASHLPCMFNGEWEKTLSRPVMASDSRRTRPRRRWRHTPALARQHHMMRARSHGRAAESVFCLRASARLQQQLRRVSESFHAAEHERCAPICEQRGHGWEAEEAPARSTHAAHCAAKHHRPGTRPQRPLTIVCTVRLETLLQKAAQAAVVPSAGSIKECLPQHGVKESIREFGAKAVLLHAPHRCSPACCNGKWPQQRASPHQWHCSAPATALHRGVPQTEPPAPAPASAAPPPAAAALSGGRAGRQGASRRRRRG